jgi:hypothetical protein
VREMGEWNFQYPIPSLVPCELYHIRVPMPMHMHQALSYPLLHPSASQRTHLHLTPVPLGPTCSNAYLCPSGWLAGWLPHSLRSCPTPVGMPTCAAAAVADRGPEAAAQHVASLLDDTYLQDVLAGRLMVVPAPASASGMYGAASSGSAVTAAAGAGAAAAGSGQPPSVTRAPSTASTAAAAPAIVAASTNDLITQVGRRSMSLITV